MGPITWLGIPLVAFGMGSVVSVPVAVLAQATQPSRNFFLSPPRLVKAETTFNRTASSNAVYYFTLDVPENAGTGMQRVAVAQRDGSNFVRMVQFDPDRIQAFVGQLGDRGTALPLAGATFDEDTQTVSLTFDPPVPPGTRVTIALKPDRNPRQSGIYLFGVTAYPPNNPEGQFLGFGRLNFYGGNDPGIFF
jgi:hypothetical protein